MPSQPLSASSSDWLCDTLAAARRGQPAALTRLFEHFYPRVEIMVHARLARDLRSARPWLAARFSTGDIVQEVFRSVLDDLGGFQGTNEGAFAGYLAMVVRNRIVDAVRYHQAEARDGRLSRQVRDEPDLRRASGDPAQKVVSHELQERFRSALRTFPERVQLLVRARLEGTDSFSALARGLGYGSTSAARREFYAAKARLVLLMGGMEEGMGADD